MAAPLERSSQARLAQAGQETEAPAARPGRPEVLAFVTDSTTEIALRDALADILGTGFDVRRSPVRGAIAALRRSATPRTLIVDISGEPAPLAALEELCQVVEPDIRLLLIGDRPEVDFYRRVTQELGALEYIYKPLQHEIIARHFGPLLLSGRQALQGGTGGRIISITGTRGGVGASTIASGLAWHFGVERNRHTVLLDSDLHRGTCAMLTGAAAGPDLRHAFETARDIDDRFVERAARQARARLDVLASEEALADRPGYSSGAGGRLLEVLRRRYNFIVVDLPFTGQKLHHELMMQTHHRVLVMDGSLAAVRDTLQLLTLPNGPMQPRRPLVVLNRLGRPGTLRLGQIERALKFKVDVVLPDLPKLVCATPPGESAIAARSAFRDGMLRLAHEVALLPGDDGPGRRRAAGGGAIGRLLRQLGGVGAETPVVEHG